MKILEKYILKENFVPFLVSLLVSTFVMLLDKIIDLLNLIIEKKLDFLTIVSIFGLSLPFMLALTIPMAILLASIMSFGRLAIDNELVAFKSCGINVYTLMRSTVLAAILISIFMLYFNNEILPETNHMLKNMMIKANYRRPVTAIVPGTFTTMKDYTIYAKERVGEDLFGIIIYVKERSNFPQTITAEKGNIILSNGGNSLKAVLMNGEMHELDPREEGKYRYHRFKTFTLNLPDLGYQLNEEGTDYRGDRELSSGTMWQMVQEKRKEISELGNEIATLEQNISHIDSLFQTNVRFTPQEKQDQHKELKKFQNMLKINTDRKVKLEKDINKYLVEINKKYAIAFACLVFVLIGAPVGMMTKSSGVAMAFTVSSFVFLVYYGTLTLGEELADKGMISPFIAMWISNIIFSILGVYLIIMSVKEQKFVDVKGFFNKITRRLKLK
ncbi:MAG: LptF/LptG family permease [Candidatus Cloacimonetes bacterium]|nr:LptF/LptG family permease [Candidatus Cloacimonadota bacterium]